METNLEKESEKKTDKKLLKKLVPFSLAVFVVLVDQLTKLWIVKTIPRGTIGYAFGGDLLRIIHVANKGVAFSIGNFLSSPVRSVLFSVVPLVMIAMVISICIRNDAFTNLQRWCISGIVGGGIGNIIDRIFRSAGVVDFIDVKFFGIFGLERWPTFNAADSAVVVCGITLAVSFLLAEVSARKKTEGGA